MLKKRIIPCLDVLDGRTVKGTRFVELRDMGDPASMALRYAKDGADELVFLDISATPQGRGPVRAWVTDVAGQLNIPFTVGGGIRNVGDASELLQSGADKISVNSAAFRDPEMIGRLASRFGSQCVVIAVDLKREENDWIVYISGGKERTGRKALDWILEAMDRGAGEVLLTSMDHDGTRGGFALELLNKVSDTVGIPVIASGGAGNMDHFRELFQETGVDAALAAGIFHEGKVRIPDLKNELKMAGIPVRI